MRPNSTKGGGGGSPISTTFTNLNEKQVGGLVSISTQHDLKDASRVSDRNISVCLPSWCAQFQTETKHTQAMTTSPQCEFGIFNNNNSNNNNNNKGWTTTKASARVIREMKHRRCLRSLRMFADDDCEPGGGSATGGQCGRIVGTAEGEPLPPFPLGDVNNDGVINVLDLVAQASTRSSGNLMCSNRLSWSKPISNNYKQNN